MNRREFLTHSGIALAGATQLSTFGRMAHAAPGGDYCAMVCILLAGGADSFNMLVPFDDDRYNEYAGVRSDLALPQGDLLELNYAGAGGAQFGVHPGMGEVQTLFNAGDLAFIANIGPLAEPTTRAAYDAGTASLPLGLFSHSDQIAVWQTSAAGVRGRLLCRVSFSDRVIVRTYESESDADADGADCASDVSSTPGAGALDEDASSNTLLIYAKIE